MKVLQVIDILNVGGAERVFVNMVNLLAEDITLEVLLFKDAGVLTPQISRHIKVHVLHRTNKYSLKKLHETYKICSAFDVVHVHMRHCYAYIRLAQFLFGGKYKIILHDHYGDIEINTAVPNKLKYIFKPGFYIGVSEALTNWAEKELKAKNVYLLRNTVMPATDFKQDTTVSKKALLISNIRPTKNIEFAIEVFKNLGRELTIYGNASEEEYYQKVAKLTGDNKPQINIVQGVSDFSAIYNEYNFAIHCAKSETGPLVLLEYMAHGIPFIAYKTGEVAHMVSKELPELFMDNFDVAAWMDRITHIQSDKTLPAKLREVFNRCFDTKKYKEECLAIYRSVNS